MGKAFFPETLFASREALRRHSTLRESQKVSTGGMGMQRCEEATRWKNGKEGKIVERREAKEGKDVLRR
jgi:hypothetical protein